MYILMLHTGLVVHYHYPFEVTEKTLRQVDQPLNKVDEHRITVYCYVGGPSHISMWGN